MAKKIEAQDWQHCSGGTNDKTRLLADGYDLRREKFSDLSCCENVVDVKISLT
jgi:hypothetical protein